MADPITSPVSTESAPPQQNGAPSPQAQVAAAVPVPSQAASQPQQPLTAQPPASETGGAAPPSLAAALRARGGHEFESDDAAYAALQQMAEMAEYGQTYTEHASDFQAFLAEKQAKAQQAQAAEAAKAQQSKWNPPEFDQEWMNHVRFDEETEAFVPKHPYIHADLAKKVNAYVKWRQGAQERILQDPAGVLFETAEERIQKAVDARIEAFYAKQQQEAQAAQQKTRDDQFLAENKGLLFQPDGQTLSPHGEAFRAHAMLLQQRGMADTGAIRDLAFQLVQADIALGKLPSAGGATPATVATPAPQGSAPAPAAERPRDPVTGKFLPRTAAEQNAQHLDAYSQPQGRNRLGDHGHAAQPDASVQAALRGEPSRNQPRIEQISDEVWRQKGLI